MRESFWAKVLFREFISHYITMTKEERAEDVEQSIVALTRLDPSGESFGSKMVMWANDRRESKAAVASTINGQLGGRPRIIKQPPSTEQLYDFCYEHQLDDGYAREWYEMCVDRGWKDRNGNPIGNWQGALKNYIKSKQKG